MEGAFVIRLKDGETMASRCASSQYRANLPGFRLVRDGSESVLRPS